MTLTIRLLLQHLLWSAALAFVPHVYGLNVSAGSDFSPYIFQIAFYLTKIIHNLLAAFDVGDITSVFKDGG